MSVLNKKTTLVANVNVLLLYTDSLAYGKTADTVKYRLPPLTKGRHSTLFELTFYSYGNYESF